MELSDEKRKAEAFDRALNAIHDGDPSKGIQHAFNEGGAPLAELIVLSRRLELDLKPAPPTRAYIAATRHRIMNVVQSRQLARQRAKQHEARRVRRARVLRPAMALASVALAIMMLFTGTGVVYASGLALPGDTLYSVKRGLETARLSLALSQSTRFDLLNYQLDERLDEVRQLSAAGRQGDLETASAAYQAALDNLLAELEAQGSQQRLENSSAMIDRHVIILEALQDRLPDAAQQSIEAALEGSKHGMEVIHGLQNGVKPNELAPGHSEDGPPGNGPPADRPGGGPPEDKPGGGPPEDKPGGGPPENKPGGGPPDDAPGGGPPEGNPGRGNN